MYYFVIKQIDKEEKKTDRILVSRSKIAIFANLTLTNCVKLHLLHVEISSESVLREDTGDMRRKR